MEASAFKATLWANLMYLSGGNVFGGNLENLWPILKTFYARKLRL